MSVLFAIAGNRPALDDKGAADRQAFRQTAGFVA
jgi:hypothetical protein